MIVDDDGTVLCDCRFCFAPVGCIIAITKRYPHLIETRVIPHMRGNTNRERK